jgi:hypothetical protein
MTISGYVEFAYERAQQCRGGSGRRGSLISTRALGMGSAVKLAAPKSKLRPLFFKAQIVYDS